MDKRRAFSLAMQNARVAHVNVADLPRSNGLLNRKPVGAGCASSRDAKHQVIESRRASRGAELPVDTNDGRTISSGSHVSRSRPSKVYQVAPR